MNPCRWQTSTKGINVSGVFPLVPDYFFSCRKIDVDAKHQLESTCRSRVCCSHFGWQPPASWADATLVYLRGPIVIHVAEKQLADVGRREACLCQVVNCFGKKCQGLATICCMYVCSEWLLSSVQCCKCKTQSQISWVRGEVAPFGGFTTESLMS